jgi:hypothetical protein
MKPFIHLVCDYAPGDLAWSEVVAAIAALTPEEPRWHVTAVGSFETIATGFVIAQLALADKNLRPPQLMVFANCAPRRDRPAARAQNEGEGLVYGVLNNGVPLLVVNSGYSLSFVRPALTELWSVNVEHHGSQFRSRDFFPRVVAAVLRGDLGFRDKALDPLSVIPDIPRGVIGYIDSFGNIKTTFREQDEEVKNLRPGERVRVIIGNTVRTATAATGSFNVHEGDLALAPGSSGHERRFWELFKRGSSAWEEFSKPRVGDSILLEPEGS